MGREFYLLFKFPPDMYFKVLGKLIDLFGPEKTQPSRECWYWYILDKGGEIDWYAPLSCTDTYMKVVIVTFDAIYPNYPKYSKMLKPVGGIFCGYDVKPWKT